MITLLKIVRLLATAFCALLVWISIRSDGAVGLIITVVPVGLVLATMWLLPLAFGRTRPAPVAKHREGFSANIVHDNIALDTGRDILWIRDPVHGERYLTRGDVLAARTAHDWRNGTFRQRLEIDVSDLQNPLWQVLFERHSDRWIKTSKHNGEERDEWFARIKAWTGLATTR